MKFQPLDHFSVSQDVLTQNINGELVLLDLDSEAYFGLDEIGTRIWLLVQSKKTVAEVLISLADEYDVSREQLEDDVDELLTKLIHTGLLSPHIA